MKRLAVFLSAVFFCAPAMAATTRDADTIVRTADTISRAATRTGGVGLSQTDQRQETLGQSRPTTTARTGAQSVVARTAVTTRTGGVGLSQTDLTKATLGQSRPTTTTTARTATTPRTTISGTTPRNGSLISNLKSPPSAQSAARAAAPISSMFTLVPTTANATMPASYNTCHDAYFTCMDQFCGQMDATYRRCICSDRLTDIKSMQDTLTATQTSLQDFQDMNIYSIDKTANEMTAATNGTTGEDTIINNTDDSAAAAELSKINSVLSTAKSNALSTAGQLDAGGNISQIRTSSDLIGSADLATMTGRKLYDQVNDQCAQMVTQYCDSDATKNMVVSAYGMAIDSDCNILQSTISGQQIAADAVVRQTNRDMQTARLGNYDAHNSAEINECIARVRTDVTSDSACGENFVRCMDITGQYLDPTTGDVLYTPDLYNLANQITLDGDPITNPQNVAYVNLLQSKRANAEEALNTCTDVADDVWNDFVSDALVEIYQGQQSKIQTAKDNCIDVLNQCYNTNLDQLRDFSDTDDDLLAGDRLELSEQLCSDRLDTCANLYGGGEPGLDALKTMMHNVGNSTLYDACPDLLSTFAKNVCTPLASDSHDYPWNCRTYELGTLSCAQQQAPTDDAATPTTLAATIDPDECKDFSTSLYARFISYAQDYCMRTEDKNDVANNQQILGIINSAIDGVRTDMQSVLKSQCEINYSGTWYPNAGTCPSGEAAPGFEKENVNKSWGSCCAPKISN